MKKIIITILFSMIMLLSITSCNKENEEKAELTYELGELNIQNEHKDGYYYMTVEIPFINTCEYRIFPEITMYYSIGEDEFYELVPTGNSSHIVFSVLPKESKNYSVTIKTDREEPKFIKNEVIINAYFDVIIEEENITTYHYGSTVASETYDCDQLNFSAKIEKKYLNAISYKNGIQAMLFLIGTNKNNESDKIYGYTYGNGSTEGYIRRDRIENNAFSIRAEEFWKESASDSWSEKDKKVMRNIKLSDYNFFVYFYTEPYLIIDNSRKH